MVIIDAATIPGSQLVNRLGKYFKKSIDGVYSIKFQPNECVVKFVVYYQAPFMSNDIHKGRQLSDLLEMNIECNITTYSDKIRVNLIELSPDEMTIGQFIISTSKFDDWVYGREFLWNKIVDKLYETFEGYEFIF